MVRSRSKEKEHQIEIVEFAFADINILGLFLLGYCKEKPFENGVTLYILSSMNVLVNSTLMFLENVYRCLQFLIL